MFNATPTDDDFPLRRLIPEIRSLKDSDPASLERDSETRKDGGSSSAVIPRSASDVNIPLAANGEMFERESSSEKSGIRRTFSENVLSTLDHGLWRRTTSEKSSDGGQKATTINKLVRQKSGLFRKDMKVHVSRITIDEQQTNLEITELPKAVLRSHRDDRETKTRSVSGSLTNLARKSWLGASRSPSPNKRKSISTAGEKFSAGVIEESSRLPLKKLPSTPPPPIPIDKDVLLTNGDHLTLERKDTTAKKAKRPLSVILRRSALPPVLKSPGIPVPSIPESFSQDTLSPLHNGRTPPNQAQALLRSTSTEKMQSSGADASRKRDELSSIFRSLDGEYQKFTTKPSSLKANIVRSTLLPFLRAYADHPSNTTLRAEDLDRRVNILNRWWIGLLEMLNGRNGQSVSGSDRPAVLEGVAGIMVRPEWRLPISAIHNRPENSRPPLKSRSTTSLQSTSSDFLAESVFHNIRNTFVQNLLSQMVFVVDKMSARSVPASVVTFCGKAAAYAFFFCPGVAEILIRLWSVSSELVRRVLSEMNITRSSDLNDLTHTIAHRFPLHLRALAFKSLPSLMRHLRSRPQIPLSSAYIPWDGPWKSRWSGRDSDLFFMFVKHYQILACDLLPKDMTKTEIACVPCYVLVQAQLLSVLDATIHRAGNSIPTGSPEGPLPLTFDDILGADTSATPLPLAPTPNASRLMAENRLIMLLREFLSDLSIVNDLARKFFAGSFLDLLKASSRRTSVFDHHACFTLCDLLEEALVILARYYGDSEDPFSFLEWEFWRRVCQQMLESNNSMTEVRLYAFIYGLWNLITKSAERKKNVSLDWLLSEEHFQRQFNHWCPMVRAYYMRLICWRLARYDGEASETDLYILSTLSSRLRQTWCHFLYIQEYAEKNGLPQPSTMPCSPAPGRRLLIVRNDINTGPAGFFLSFDAIAEPTNSTQSTAYERYSSLDSMKDGTWNSNGQPMSSSPGRKKWGLLRNMNPFTSTSFELYKASETGRLDGNPADTRQVLSDATSPSSPTSSPTVTRNPVSPPGQQSQVLSFKFSLEWNDRNAGHPTNRRLYPPRLPLPAQMFLQSKQPESYNFKPSMPEGSALGPSKYSGRALAEWALLVAEFQNFFERRKYEGIPGLKRVETPTLGVDPFRRPA
ncbi:hypothetical protein MMC18_006881 [Xylographa bjoerkii]|nr:hypothetical protein [Xylographa bjoerkii]